MFVADACAALAHLAARPEVDPRRVALAGFSYGGMATQHARCAQMADALAPDGLRFVGHVSYYAPCIARFVDNRTTGAPLFMLYGADDQLIQPDRCEQTASEMRRGGSHVEIIAYPGAVHQWDGSMQAGLKWSSQHVEGGVAMTRRRRRSDGLVERHCSHQVARWWQDEMSGGGSGRRSRQVWQVRMLRSKLVCRRL